MTKMHYDLSVTGLQLKLVYSRNWFTDNWSTNKSKFDTAVHNDSRSFFS